MFRIIALLVFFTLIIYIPFPFIRYHSLNKLRLFNDCLKNYQIKNTFTNDAVTENYVVNVNAKNMFQLYVVVVSDENSCLINSLRVLKMILRVRVIMFSYYFVLVSTYCKKSIKHTYKYNNATQLQCQRQDTLITNMFSRALFYDFRVHPRQ